MLLTTVDEAWTTISDVINGGSEELKQELRACILKEHPTLTSGVLREIQKALRQNPCFREDGAQEPNHDGCYSTDGRFSPDVAWFVLRAYIPFI